MDTVVTKSGKVGVARTVAKSGSFTVFSSPFGTFFALKYEGVLLLARSTRSEMFTAIRRMVADNPTMPLDQQEQAIHLTTLLADPEMN